jgi:hypothetical protein
MHPKTYRYVTKRSGDEELRRRLRELASQRRRFGYRRLGLMLERQGIEGGAADGTQTWWPQTSPRHQGADGHSAGS